MTTSPTYAAEEWTPLDASGRTWETGLPAGSTSSTSRTVTRPVQDRLEKGLTNDDLAIEAGYSRPHRLTSPATVDHSDERVIDHPTLDTTRHKPPQIREQHVWGVADEWGKKAGKWGEGAKAFRNGTGSGEGDDEESK